MSNVIHTLGDSTLDNLHWMLGIYGRDNLDEAKANSVEGKIQTLVGDDYLVCSHAYDGFTTQSVLGSDRIGRVLPWVPDQDPYIQEKTEGSGIRDVRPLEDLSREVQVEADKTHFVVLSVGGNDFRENLANPFRLLSDIPDIQSRYCQILDRLQNLDVKPILMLQYRPDANNDVYSVYGIMSLVGSVAAVAHLVGLALFTAPIFVFLGEVSLVAGAVSFLAAISIHFFTREVTDLATIRDVVLNEKNIGMVTLGRTIELFYRPILEKASESRIPILDLSNSFNPYEDLYESGIEPSQRGADVIASGISHIVGNHDYEGASQLYSQRDPDGEEVEAYAPAADQQIGFSPAENEPFSWKVDYPDRVQ